MIPVLIPAYKPDEKLLSLVDDLKKLGDMPIVIVRDGGGEEYDPLFQVLENDPSCHVLVHAVNLGKGRALKTGLNHIMNSFPQAVGCVTADADGQHLPVDIMRVAACLEQHPSSLVLGVRDFGTAVPLRSKFGNILTKYVFFLLVGKKISDTQTGLRGISATLFGRFMRLHGEGYEYETQMLIATKELNVSIKEEQIATVYIENNRSSHFNPLLDSMRIYFQLLRFSFSAIASFCIDYFLFLFLLSFSHNIATASYVSRALSMLFNFKMNARFVFATKQGHAVPFAKYALLSLFSITVSYSIVLFMFRTFSYSPAIVKLFVECLLFFLNFAVQRSFVFRPRDGAFCPQG